MRNRVGPLEPAAGSANTSSPRLIHVPILDAKHGSSALNSVNAAWARLQEADDQTFLQRCISARHQSAAEWRTLCHGRACTTGREAQQTEVEMSGAIEKYLTFALPSAAKCCGCKATNQHAASIRRVSRSAYKLQASAESSYHPS